MILCWELSIISQKCFVQSVDMRVANVEISWTYPQITSSREATQPTRQHNGHSPWCRVSQFYKQVRCCPLPMSEKPQWYQNMEHLWIADLRSSNSSFQVTLSSHTILYLLRVLMFVSFFFTGLMTPRLVHILGQHAWNTKPVPLRASMTLWSLKCKTVEPGNIGTSYSKLLVKLQVLVRVALEVFLVGAPLFLWQSRHMLRLKHTMVLVFIKTSFIWSRLWASSSDCNAEKYYTELWCNVEAHDFFKELLAVFAYLLLSILKSDK